jgi:hypothetical protein
MNIFDNLFEVDSNLSEQADSILSEYTSPFKIPAGKHSKPGNTGKVGFFFESQFGIDPNNSRNPDFGNHELKSVLIKGNSISSVSIATVARNSYNSINTFPSKSFFDNSAPYLKMRNTLYIFYKKVSTRQELYQVENWNIVSLDDLDNDIKEVLENDYKLCTGAMKKYSYETLSKTGDHFPCTEYLQLTYKGSRGYNYPSWKFSKEFMKIIQYS